MTLLIPFQSSNPTGTLEMTFRDTIIINLLSLDAFHAVSYVEQMRGLVIHLHNTEKKGFLYLCFGTPKGYIDRNNRDEYEEH